MKKTQKERVISQILKQGWISRNQCLGTYPCISRLGAIIATLKEEGWDFETKDTGKDYVYTPTKCPLTKSVYKVNGKEIITYER